MGIIHPEEAEFSGGGSDLRPVTSRQRDQLRAAALALPALAGVVEKTVFVVK